MAFPSPFPPLFPFPSLSFFPFPSFLPSFPSLSSPLQWSSTIRSIHTPYKNLILMKPKPAFPLPRLRDLQDMIPFYLCKTGNFLDAAHSLLFPVNSLASCSACRITPCQFKVYLKIFRTGCVPSGNDMLETGPWATAGKCHFFLPCTENFITAFNWHSNE